MTTKRHFPAYDFDCDDDEPKAPANARDAAWRTAQRRIRTRKIVGEGTTREEMLVDCPFRDKWPTFDECLRCEHFRGFSLDPAGKDSFTSCCRQGEGLVPALPGQSDRSRALRTNVTLIMSDPVCVEPGLELSQVATLLIHRGIGSALVIDGEGKPIGVVTKTDLVEAQALVPDGTSLSPDRKGRGLVRVVDVMTTGVLSVRDNASVADAAELMAKKNVHRVAVVSGSGHAVGILSALDVTRWLSSPGRSSTCPAAL